MKILFLCHDPPAPVTNGGVMDMMGMCQALHDLGHDVHLVYTPKSSNTQVHQERLAGASQLQESRVRNTGLGAAISWLPYQISSRRALREQPFSYTYDVVIASDHCSGILLNQTLTAKFKVLRRQNIEADYALRMAQGAGHLSEKIFFYKEYLAFRRWNKHIDPIVDQIWYVSTEEISQQSVGILSNKTAHKKPARLLIPAALGDTRLEPVNLERLSRRRVLYFGSMTVAINRQSVDWYVQNVHPRLCQLVPGYELVIAGRVDPSLRGWSSVHESSNGYTFIPSPEDAEAIYAPGGIFIDPMAHDAGIKLKIIEAIRRGYPVVCSPNSLYGSGLLSNVHALTATTVDEFCQALVYLLTHPDAAADLVKRAQEQVRAHFDIKRSIADALLLLTSKNT